MLKANILLVFLQCSCIFSSLSYLLIVLCLQLSFLLLFTSKIGKLIALDTSPANAQRNKELGSVVSRHDDVLSAGNRNSELVEGKNSVGDEEQNRTDDCREVVQVIVAGRTFGSWFRSTRK